MSIPKLEDRKPPKISDREFAFFRTLWNDPEWTASHVFGRPLWEKQATLARMVRDHKYVACASANSMGKTEVTSMLAVTFLMAHYPCYVVITAANEQSIQPIGKLYAKYINLVTCVMSVSVFIIYFI